MGVSEILSEIDLQIKRLRQARALLSDEAGFATGKAATASSRQTTKKKRNLSPEGRKRIAEAVKRRWEKQKKAKAAK